MNFPKSDFEVRLVRPGFLDADQIKFLGEVVERSPEPGVLVHFLVRYAERHRLPQDRQLLLALATAAGHSPFLGQLLLLNPDYLPWATEGLAGNPVPTPEDLREALARFRFTLSSLPVETILRRFKHRAYLRIALKDFLGIADLTDTVRELSLLADLLIQEAYLEAWQELVREVGPPQYTDDRGWISEAEFAVLSLGKLGGEELNYSSDIDLIYLFSREGHTRGREGGPETIISNREFFTRLAGRLTQCLAGISNEGQVFRVDLDLRPGGGDGELVQSHRSALAYYKTWARTWERQALIKARYSAGSRAFGRRFLRETKEIVYSNPKAVYVPLEIKEMKDSIDKQLTRRGRNETDIKLGRGGLRELEFAVQALQMVHGMEDPWLREGNTLRSLHRLADKEKVSYSDHFALSRAYVFLRRLEHRLQLERNRQTTSLPTSSESIRALARRLGYLEAPHEAEDFLRDLEQHRSVIRSFYDTVFGQASQVTLTDVELDPLLDDLSDAETERIFREGGVDRPHRMVPHAKRIRRLLSPAKLRPSQRREFRRFSTTVVREATHAADPDRVLGNLERFLSTLLIDPAASELFFEQPDWIPPLVHLLGKSEHLSQMVIRRPEVFPELGKITEEAGGRTLKGPGDRLGALLASARELRTAAATLRNFHHMEVLLVGLRDVHAQDSLAKTLSRLTQLAETCLRGAEGAARGFFPAVKEEVGSFAVLGLGRLGYGELDYNSDLDLVFVADGPPEEAIVPETLQRRAERLIHLLTAVTQEGSLYSVDLRLRPAGREGELVQSRRRLQSYFAGTARTWEKMAFLKGRAVAGDLKLGTNVLREIQEQILDGVDPSPLAREVREMKIQLEQNQPRESGDIAIKLGPGGLLEIHFLIEYLQMRHRQRRPPEVDTLQMLTHLNREQLITDADYSTLYAGYHLLRGLDHGMRLLYDRPADRIPSEGAVWDRLAREGRLLDSTLSGKSGPVLREKVEKTLSSVRSCFDRLVR